MARATSIHLGDAICGQSLDLRDSHRRYHLRRIISISLRQMNGAIYDAALMDQVRDVSMKGWQGLNAQWTDGDSSNDTPIFADVVP